MPGETGESSVGREANLPGVKTKGELKAGTSSRISYN